MVDLTERAKNAAEADARRAQEAADRKAQAARRERADTQKEVSDLSRAADQQQARADRLDSAAEGDARLTERLLSKGMNVARLPLNAVEKVTGKRGSNWPPAVGFDSLEATVMQVTGGLLRDKDMVRRGRSKQAAAASKSEAVNQQAEADRLALEAEQREATRLELVEQDKRRARERSKSRKQELDKREQGKRQEVANTARTRKTNARERAAKAEEGLENRERNDALSDAEGKEKAAVRQDRSPSGEEGRRPRPAGRSLACITSVPPKLSRPMREPGGCRHTLPANSERQGVYSAQSAAARTGEAGGSDIYQPGIVCPPTGASTSPV